MKAGKEYELFIEKIYRDLDPFAEITQDAYLQGRETKIMRQIDVAIKFERAGFEFLTIVQAKDLGTKVDVNVVHILAGVMQDVGANKGVIICLKGFSKAAKDLAKIKNIELLTYHGTNKMNWRTIVDINVKRTIYDLDYHLKLASNVADMPPGTTFEFSIMIFKNKNGGMFSLDVLISEYILTKQNVERIKNGEQVVVDLSTLSLDMKLGDYYCPCFGTLTIKLLNKQSDSYYINPLDYIVGFDHLANKAKYHKLTLDQISLSKYLDPEYIPVRKDSKTRFRDKENYIEAEVYQFKAMGFSAKMVFNFPSKIQIYYYVDKDGNMFPYNELSKHLFGDPNL